MSVYHLRGSHLKLIAVHSAKHGIRGGTGLVFTFTALVHGELRAGDKVIIGQTLRAGRQQSPLGPGGMRRF